jgi:hypothetical protein
MSTGVVCFMVLAAFVFGRISNEFNSKKEEVKWKFK